MKKFKKIFKKFIFLIHLPLDYKMKDIRLIPNIHVFKQQV